MKGLLIKDFIIIKKHCLLSLAVSALFLAMSLFSGKSMYFLFYSIAMVSIIPINTIAYDEAYKWNKYELLLPVSRVTAVCEKYMLLFIIIAPVILFEGLVSFFVFGFQISDLLSLMSIMLFCGTMSPIVVFPVVYKFGYIKGKFINLIIIAVLASSITFINAKNISGGTLISGGFTPQKNTFLFAVIAVIMIIVSILLSVNAYKKREI